VTSFSKSGYQIIYAGNGISDFPAAKRCHHIFATEELLERCTEANLDCNAFTDFNDILRVLEAL
jgi:2-hydroxy-3-keto-5-methylthiopentenyl-1-phosphate phosphatase